MKNIIKFINEWGVPLIILSLPLYLVRFKILGVPATLLELIFAIVFLSWFLENYQGLKSRIKSKISNRARQIDEKEAQVKNYPFSVFIILFLLSSFIALTTAGFSFQALGVYKAYFIEAVLFFVLTFNYFKKEENRERVFWALAISAFVVSVIAIFQKISGIYWTGGVGEERVTSIFLYPNALGLYLGPIATFLYFYFLELIQGFSAKGGSAPGGKDSKIQRFKAVFIGLSFILSFLSIYFAKSEAGLAAVLISIFIGSIFVSKRLAIVFIVFLFIGSAVIFSNTNSKNFIFEKAQLKDFSGEVRKQQWRETVEMLKNDQKYILGCGLSGYQECVEPYHQEGIFFNKDKDPDFRRKIVIFDDQYRAERWRPVEIYMYPHNIFLNFWVEIGILGLVAFLGILIQFFYFSFKIIGSWKLKIENSGSNNNRILLIGIMAVMIEILIHGFVDVPYFKNDLAFLFWLFVAMMGVYWVENKRIIR